MIRWWSDPGFDEDVHQPIIYVTDTKFAVATTLTPPMYGLYTANKEWRKYPVIGPNEMSRWENDDAT